LGKLDPPAPDVLPAIIANHRNTSHLNIGDRFSIQFGLQKLEAEVTGIVNEFPTLEDVFVITSLPQLEQMANLTDYRLARNSQRELWLELTPTTRTAAMDTIEAIPLPDQAPERIVSDAKAWEAVLQTNLISRETLAGLRLNAGILIILSSVGFMLVQLFSARSRLSEFAMLRAMGVAQQQIFRLIFAEGALMLLFGLVVGAGIGYLLAHIMHPFLSQMLANALGGGAIFTLNIPWLTLFAFLLILLAFYLVMLVLLRVTLARLQVQRLLRMGEE
jgi:predicted lysophospholipase L1 biosynthesis ABC-type transport system permease subunit